MTSASRGSDANQFSLPRELPSLPKESPSLGTMAKVVPKVMTAQFKLQVAAMKSLPLLGDAIREIQHRTPFSTIPAEGTKIHRIFQKETPLKSLDSERVMSNMPNDEVNLSKKDRAILNKFLSLNVLSPENTKGIKKLLNHKISPMYASLSQEERDALDLYKFFILKNHFDDFMKADQENKLDDTKTAFNNIEVSANGQSTGIDYEQAHVAEVLSKSLAYINPSVLNGRTIHLPFKGSLVEYNIKVHNFPNSTMPFLVLTPKSDPDAPPWVVIRGTDPNSFGKGSSEAKQSSFESVAADLRNSKGMDPSHIDNNMGSLFTLLKGLSSNQPVQLVGHSLGGWGAQHLAVKLQEANENLPDGTPDSDRVKLGNVYGFNSPGVSKETKKTYDNLKEKPALTNFNDVGDSVPSLGRCLIGAHVRVKEPGLLGGKGFLDSHRGIRTHKKCTIQIIDVEAENKKWSRRLMEGVRSNLGPLAGNLAASNAEELKSKQSERLAKKIAEDQAKAAAEEKKLERKVTFQTSSGISSSNDTSQFL